MAAKVGKIEKELKAPDQFVSFWANVGKAAGENRRTILIAAGATVALVLVVLAVRAFSASRAEEATRAFARIARVASAPIVAEGSTAPQGAATTFKTERDRAEATLKEVDAFLSAHGGSPLRDEVELQRGRLLIALGRAPEAVTLYEGLRGSIDARLRFLAEEGLAYAQEAAGQLDQALATVSALADRAKDGGGFYRDRALFHKARLLEAKGSGKDAEKVYREILAETPTSALKEEINNRLATLETK